MRMRIIFIKIIHNFIKKLLEEKLLLIRLYRVNITITFIHMHQCKSLCEDPCWRIIVNLL